jgi:hypothetical protein
MTGKEDESRTASVPPIKFLLCRLVGSWPLPGLLRLIEAGGVIIELILSSELCG